MWLGKGDEGAKYWLGVVTELRNRGVARRADRLLLCRGPGYADDAPGRGVRVGEWVSLVGHEDTSTTQIYLHSDMTIKEKALACVPAPNTTPGRYQPPDKLLAFSRDFVRPPSHQDYAEPTTTSTPLTSDATNKVGITLTTA